ncbi:MAG: extracellular solute-binding protein [Chitinispirillaceae bacterium]
MKFTAKFLTAITSVCLFLAGCAPQVDLSVLASMSQDQQKFLENEILPRFEDRNRCRVEIINVDYQQKLWKEVPDSLDLVKVPFTAGRQIARNFKFLILDSVLEKTGNEKFKKQLLLTSLGAVDGDQFYIPREFDTRLIVYRKSKVREALEKWRRHRNSIDKSIRRINGYGLPSNYLLEENPEEWDFFDVFVMGWLWASGDYGGSMQPRIAHPVNGNKGLAPRQVDHLVQFGIDSSEMLNMQSEGVIDMFEWEAVFASVGIYNPLMWKENWDSKDVWEAFGNDEVFLSFLSPSDCFYIHGTGKDSVLGYLDDPEDMGTATMPRACSVELDSMGMPLREGSKSVMTGGWWWGIPASSSDPALSLKLVCFLSQNEIQIKECSNFGMIPVRKDVLSFMPIMFGDGWVTQVYNTSFQQLMHNDENVIAGGEDSQQMYTLYLEAWNDIVVQENWSEDSVLPDRSYIRRLLRDRYSSQVESTLIGQTGTVHD